jgi:hypothetical protein
VAGRVRSTTTGGPPRPCERCGGPVAHKTGRPVCKDCRVDDRSQPYRRDVQLNPYTASHRPTTTGFSSSNTAGARSAGPPNRAPGALGELTTITKPARYAASCATAATSAFGYMQDDSDILMAAARYVMQHRQKKG